VTQIDFYVHVDDKADTARRLCIKAYGARARVLVWTTDPLASQKLSRLLWSQPSTGFLPHCASSDPLAPRTPVIVDHRDDPLPHDDILLNLRTEVPGFFSRFQRLIEIVGPDPEDQEAARGRFRFYRDRGYPLRTHDLSAARPARAGVDAG